MTHQQPASHRSSVQHGERNFVALTLATQFEGCIFLRRCRTCFMQRCIWQCCIDQDLSYIDVKNIHMQLVRAQFGSVLIHNCLEMVPNFSMTADCSSPAISISWIGAHSLCFFYVFEISIQEMPTFMYVDKYKKEVYGIRFHCPCWNLQRYEFGYQIPYKTKEK
jgi:hypothetical protein